MFEFLYRVADDKVVKVSDYSIAPLYKGDFYLSNDNISITKWWAPEILDVEKGSTPGFSHKTDCVSFLGLLPFVPCQPKLMDLILYTGKYLLPLYFCHYGLWSNLKIGKIVFVIILDQNHKSVWSN